MDVQMDEEGSPKSMAEKAAREGMAVAREATRKATDLLQRSRSSKHGGRRKFSSSSEALVVPSDRMYSTIFWCLCLITTVSIFQVGIVGMQYGPAFDEWTKLEKSTCKVHSARIALPPPGGIGTPTVTCQMSNLAIQQDGPAPESTSRAGRRLQTGSTSSGGSASSGGSTKKREQVVAQTGYAYCEPRLNPHLLGT